MSAVPTDRPESYIADVAEALLHEYGDVFGPSVVCGVVLDARDDLRGQVLDTAFPEMLDRLCRARLAALRTDLSA